MTKATAQRIQMNLELLQRLVHAYTANETAQRRFRNTVLIRLSRIEQTVSMIHAVQIVELHKNRPCSEEKIDEHTKEAEEFISQKSHAMGMAMVNYIYGESKQPAAQTKVPRKRSR